ncbi:MAG: 23S rRNA (pseudouridine(1915)-N(3))-methyltransferase RlmH [Candidatus Moduliflexus flocculans]|nr:23S rRNA (pseudouridine(1915)-N(3))-methyltransferase RlmH [Candidatus Moduliflexus flocculans]
MIGGSHGLSERRQTSGRRCSSFSPMTFPHQLMRARLARAAVPRLLDPAQHQTTINKSDGAVRLRLHVSWTIIRDDGDV